MRKILTFLLLGIISSTFIIAQPAWQWAYKAGGTTTTNNIDVTYGVAKDGLNNVYSCGSYQGTVTIGANTWTAATRNAWVGKQTSDGQWIWSVTGGGNIAAQAITVDSNGDVIVVGSCTGGTTLNGFTINSLGGANTAMFVAKLNGITGAVLWAKEGRTPTSGGSVDAFGVAVDNVNNVYVAGRGKGAINFASTLTFTSSSSTVAQTLDGYILKLNSNGTPKFVNRIYGATTGNADKNCYSVATDNLGHVYALGYFQSTIARLDNTYFISNTNTTSTTNDIFLAKYDTSGATIGMFKYGSATTTVQDFAYNIKMINDTIAVFAGQSNNLATLTKVNTNTGSSINNFTASGNGTSVFYSIDKDANANIYATGFISSDNATGQNFGTTNLKTNSQNDLLLIKTDATLSTQSAINFGNTSTSLTNELGRCLVTLGTDDNVIGGIFASNLTLGISNMSAQGNSDLLIARYAPCAQSLAITTEPINDTTCASGPATFSFATNMPNYTIMWYKNGAQMSGNTNDTLSTGTFSNLDNFFAIATSACGTAQTQTVYVHVLQAPAITLQPIFNTSPYCFGDTAVIVVGATGDNLSYQWRKGTTVIPGENNDTLLIVCNGTSVTGTYNCIVSNQCNSVTSNNGLISNVYSPATITASPSNSIICAGTTSSISPNSVSGATSYQWYLNGNPISGANSINYTISNMQAANTGTYSLVAIATCGNDTAEIRTVSLGTNTVLNSSTTTGSSCPGTDMTYALDVTGTNVSYQWFLNSNVIAGATNDTLVINNISSAMNGQYQVQISGACGSTISAGISTLSVPTFITSITVSGNMLISDDNNSGSFQWIDCNNGNQIIPGENSIGFSPSSNGNYAVILSHGICTDTSNCISINTIGLNTFNLSTQIEISPNPVKDFVKIKSISTTQQNSEIKIMGIDGKIVLSQMSTGNTTNIDLSSLSNGVYFIQVYSATSTYTQKIIKQ